MRIGVVDDESVMLPALQLENRASVRTFMDVLAKALDAEASCFRWGIGR